MHAGSIQVRLLGILAIGVICSLIACTGGAAATPAPSTPPSSVTLEVTPGTTEVSTGDSITVTAKVSGSSNIGVTWSVNGIPNGNTAVGTISGSGTTVTYTAPATEGTYTLTATSVVDGSKQGNSKVTVKTTGKPISVTLNPTASTLLTGGAQAFTVTVLNTLNTAVDWTVDGIPNGNAATGLVTGAGSTVTYLAPSTAGSHTLTATSVVDPSRRASAGLTITAPALTVAVSVSPTSLSLAAGASASFTATVSGTATTGVSWTVDGIANGNSTVGTLTGSGNTAIYTAPAAGGLHTLVATSQADPTKSASASLTVQAPVALTVTPGTATMTAGTSTSFSASVSGTTNLATTWAVDGVLGGNSTVGTLSGTGNSRTYTAPATAGTRTITATSSADPTKIASAVVTVQAAPVTTVALSPTSLTLAAGASSSFTATVSGTTTTGVTWKVDGVANGNSTVGTVAGSGNTVTYTAPTAGGAHTLVATSTVDLTKSASAAITVQPPPVTISLSPATSSVTGGTSATFTASVSGTTNTATTWTVDGVSGGNSTVGTLTGTGNSRTYTAPLAAGTHTIRATSSADATKAASSAVTVQAAPTVSVALSPTALTLATGASASFIATVSGTTTTGVAWKVDGIANGNSTVGTVTGSGSSATYTAPSTGGIHTLVATSTADATKSASATLTVEAPQSVISLTLSPGTSTVSGGSATTFTASISGTANTGTTWTVDGITNGSTTVGTLSGTGSSRIYTAPTASGTHTIRATSTADPTKTASSTVTVQASTAIPTGFVVAPNGVLGNPGTLAAPTTLEGARTLIQNASRANPGTLRVLLRGGIYPRTSSFTLGAADSGSAANPVEWAAYPDEVPRIIGGVAINPAAVKLVDGTDPNWSRLDAAARPYIYVVDLSASKGGLGALTSRSDSGGTVNQSAEVFVDGAPLTLARYPKAVPREEVNIAPQAALRVSGTLTPDVTGDYAFKGLDNLGRPYYQLSKNGVLWSIAASASSSDWRLSSRKDLGGSGASAYWGTWDTFAGPAGAFTPAGGAAGTAFLAPADGSLPVPGFLLIRSTNGTTQITAPDPRMSRWRASEAMYYGLGYYSWSGSHSPLTSLDPTTGTLVLSTSPTYGFRPGQPFFVYNLLEELTDPGDYFIDRTNARLYLRPPGDKPPTELLLSTLQTPVVQMSGCQQVTWSGVSFEASKDRLVYAPSATSVAFKNCRFRNAGGYGLVLSGSSNLVEACDFRQLGQGGILAAGGDRMTLTPSRTVIQNNEFQYFGRLFWTYQPAVRLYSLSDWAYNNDCIGFTIQHNEIHHAPHAAILFSGNEQVIRYNHIHHVTEWANDSGVIYTTGREWGTQGNLIQFNLIRDCGGPLGTFVSGIYIDGIGSGVKIEGNILYKVSPSFAIQHNGGRDVVTQYNVMVGHWYGVDISNVAFEFANNTAGSSWNLLGKLQHFNYQSAPWSTAYPHVAAIPNSWSLIQGTHWLEPEGSVCYGNLQQGPAGEVYRQHNSASSLAPPVSWFTKVGSNLSQVDPLFSDPKNLDFSLQPSSPMFSVPGFPGIDASRIGIQK